MEAPFNIISFIDKEILKVAKKCEGFNKEFHPEVRVADPRFGDFQANGVLPFAKKNQQNPRALATTLADALKESPTFKENEISISIAGPGFINFSLGPKFLSQWLECYEDEKSLKKGAEALCSGEKVVVDYSSPNTAKQMHVGHLRSSVIGESICRVLRFCGAEVVGDNHIGDWGTQFGMLIMAIKQTGFDIFQKIEDPLEKLENLYKEGRKLFDEDEDAQKEARDELVKLQQGDPENMKLWERINEISYQAFQEVYDLLNIKHDVILGESFYRDKVDNVWKELEAEKIAEISEGALVVFHPEHPRYAKTPFIVRKSDGASNYATTDLATLLYRKEHFNADWIINITDARQKDHFEQLALTGEKWFKATKRTFPKMTHVTFGTILGEDGKAIKTRSGDPIKLKELLNESVQRAQQIVNEKAKDLSDSERKEIAETVGIAAVRYADLMQNRSSDYIFSWDKMLSFEGNTAPYLLYAGARIHSILRKVKEAYPNGDTATAPLETEAEIALAKQLANFPVSLEQTVIDLRPHNLCQYLYDLSGAFSSFYNADKVMVDDDAVRNKRLMLCSRTLSTLECGLHLLGIKTLERM